MYSQMAVPRHQATSPSASTASYLQQQKFMNMTRYGSAGANRAIQGCCVCMLHKDYRKGCCPEIQLASTVSLQTASA